MFRKRMSSATAQLTLVAVLWVASPGLTRAAVLERTIGHARPGTTLSSEGLFSHLLDWLVSLSHGNLLTGKDQGSILDPNGSPKPNPAVYTSPGSGSAHIPDR
jgi:hypothetical protein